MFRTLYTLLFAALLTAQIHAQALRVRADADSTNYLIGQWITLHLSVEAPASWTVHMPKTDEDFTNAEFVAADEATSSVEGTTRKLRQDVVVTVFDTGRIPVSAIVHYRMPGDTTTYTATSNSIDMQITTVALDTTQSFRDITDVLHVPLTIWDYLLYAGIVLLLALLIWFGWRWYRARKGAEESLPPPPEPEIPPAVIALRDLEMLREDQLWQSGKHKAYQSRLTDILRAYIERRFTVPAMEHPTSEIMPEIAMLGLEPERVDGLERVLRTADMTKFAKYTPTPQENESGMSYAVTFVRDTRDDTGTAYASTNTDRTAASAGGAPTGSDRDPDISKYAPPGGGVASAGFDQASPDSDHPSAGNSSESDEKEGGNV